MRILFALALALIAVRVPAQRDRSGPIVAGAMRAGLSSRERGEVLRRELACDACHGEASADAERVPWRRGPSLLGIGARVDPGWLEAWLAAPKAVRPGTTMPDLLHGLADAERADAARALAHFLRTLSPAKFERQEHEADAATRGFERFHAMGCVACHAPRDEQGRERSVAGSVPLGALQDKYSVASLRAFLLDPHRVRPSARMPSFRLDPGQANDLAHFLTNGERTDRTVSTDVDPALAERGRRLFRDLRCAACHDGVLEQGAERVGQLTAANADSGCLAPEPEGKAPDFGLSQNQRAALAESLVDTDWTEQQRVRLHLAARNCVACHARGELGGVVAERDQWFGSDDAALGDLGRLPPPLTGVGARLQPDWLLRAIAHGQDERGYMRTRMPGFGADLAEELAPLLERVDAVESPAVRPLPKPRKEANAEKDLGRELVGEKGMGCIACHTFAGRKAGAMGAIDLVASTGRRLRPEWFRRFLLDPTGYRSGTIMPRYFVNGASTRPDLGDGDVERQLAAIWHYLAAGRNVRRPAGLRNPAIELRVGDEAVMLRRAVQNTGKRGISVGYPGGVNLTFDAETLARDQIWWGRFLDVGGVFHGQGHGRASPRSRDRVALGKGSSIAAAGTEEPWAVVKRRMPGSRFFGYDLDEQRRPTFRYSIDAIDCTDFCQERSAEPFPELVRTVTLRSARTRTIAFRVARNKKIEPLGERRYRIGRGAVVRVPLPARLRAERSSPT